MSTDKLDVQEALKKLNEMAEEMQKMHQELQQKAQVYNELMFVTFGVKDDGKNSSKLDLLNLISKFQK